MLSEFTLAWENEKKNVMCSSFSSSFTNNYPFKRRRYIFKNEQMKKRFSLSLHSNFISPKYVSCALFCAMFFCKQEMFFSANSLFGCRINREMSIHIYILCSILLSHRYILVRWALDGKILSRLSAKKQKSREEKSRQLSNVEVNADIQIIRALIFGRC